MRISDWSSDVCSSDLQALPSPKLYCWRGRTVKPGWPSMRRTTSTTKSRNAALSINRSEERRVGKSVSVRVDLGGRRIIKKKKKQNVTNRSPASDRKYTKRKLRAQPQVI